MDEFGEGFESESSFDSGIDLGGSESFETFDTPDISLTESEPVSDGFDDLPMDDFSSGVEDLSLDETPSLDDLSSDMADLPFDEAAPIDDTVPVSTEIPESSDSFEELPFVEAEAVPEMPEVPDESESMPFEEVSEPEVIEPVEDNSGLEDYDYETAPETLDDQNAETAGEFAPSDNPYGETWEQFSEEINEGDDQPADWDSLQDVPFAGEETPESMVEDKPYDNLAEYMSAHNYGPGDFETYSQDAEWRELMRNEYPDYELPELSQESAQEQLNQYMSDHNYGLTDYDEYSQDPIWRDLHSTVYPDNELPPLNEEMAEPEAINEAPEFDINYDEIYEGLSDERLAEGFEDIDIYEDPERLDSSLSNFETDTWDNLTLDEQKQSMNNLADYIEDVIGFENPPKIEYYNNEDGGDFGGYDSETNTLSVNEYNLYNNSEAADTIAHELWHAHQHECADHPTSARDYQYQFNFENYISPDMDFESYQDQLIEAEARSFAEQIKDRLASIS